MSLKLAIDLLDHALKIRADAVHLVHKCNPGNVVPVRLSPDRLGLGLHPLHRRENPDGTVQHPQAALDLSTEIHMPGRVHNVDFVSLPVTGGSCGGDGDAPLLLLLHPIHHRSTLIDRTHLVALAGVIEYALGDRGLACIDVGNNADVALLMQVDLLCSHAQL